MLIFFFYSSLDFGRKTDGFKLRSPPFQISGHAPACLCSSAFTIMLFPCGVASIKNINYSKTQLLQNKVILVICNSNRFSSITPLSFELGILKINELFSFEIGKLMHQHSHNLLPPAIFSLFTELFTIHSRQTRSQTQKSFHLIKFSTQRCQRFIQFQITKIWNSFSPAFKIFSFRKFKTKYEK